MRGRNGVALVSPAETWELPPVCQGNAGDEPKVQTQQQDAAALHLARRNDISHHCFLPAIGVRENFFCMLSTTIGTDFFRPSVQRASYAEGNRAQVSFSVSVEPCTFPSQRRENPDAISASSQLVATRTPPTTFPRGEKSCLRF